jgi:HPt (histidine-containing phosphotransfer) domain-containing protein
MNDREPDVSAVQTRLNELTRKFIARTALDLAQMREGLAWLAAGNGDDIRSALAQVHHLAHRICGTSGTLGLLGLSDAAADLERCIEAFPTDAIPDTEQRTQIAAGISRISAQLRSL